MAATIKGPDGKPRCKWCNAVYAFMQAMSLINDHVEGCVIRDKVESARKKFKRPGH